MCTWICAPGAQVVYDYSLVQCVHGSVPLGHRLCMIIAWYRIYIDLYPCICGSRCVWLLSSILCTWISGPRAYAQGVYDCRLVCTQKCILKCTFIKLLTNSEWQIFAWYSVRVLYEKEIDLCYKQKNRCSKILNDNDLNQLDITWHNLVTKI